MARKVWLLVGLLTLFCVGLGWFLRADLARAAADPLTPTAADLQITMAAQPDPVKVGDPLTYTIVVRNIGPSIAFSLTIRDQLPAGVNFSGATTIQTLNGFDSNVQLSTRAFTTTVTMLEPGGIVTITARTLVGIAATGTSLTNQATVTASNEENLTNNSTSHTTVLIPLPVTPTATPTPMPTPVMDLRINKRGFPDPVQPGQWLTYTTLVQNLGSLTAANVVISETLPANLRYDGQSRVTVDRGTLPVVAVTTNLLTARIAQLDPGGTITITSRTLVGLSVTGPTLDSTVRMAAGLVGAEKRYSASLSTQLVAAPLAPTPTTTPLPPATRYQIYAPTIQR